MSEKKFIVKDGDEIIITVPSKSSPAAQIIGAPRKGMIRPPFDDDILPRRLFGKGITFYDLGQINIGTLEVPIWANLPPIFFPVVSMAVNRDASPLEEYIRVGVERFGDAQFTALREMILAVPVEELSKRFRRIPFEVAFPYDFSIRDKNEEMQTINQDAFLTMDIHGLEWKTPGVLEHKELPYFEQRDSEYMRFTSEIDSGWKITAEPIFDADEVAFPLPAKFECFLMPKIGLHVFKSEYAQTTYDGGMTTEISTHDVLNVFYETHARTPHPNFVDPNFDANTTASGNPSGIKTNWKSYAETMPDARAFRVVRTSVYPDGSPDFSTTTYSGEIAASEFGDNVNGNGRFTFRYYGQFVADTLDTIKIQADPINTGAPFFNQSEPTLVAILKAGATVYYVWDADLTASFESRTFNLNNGLRVRYEPA